MFIKRNSKLASIIISLLLLYCIILVYTLKAVILLKQKLYTSSLNIKVITKTTLSSSVFTTSFAKTNK